jgi:hypothetical protein
MGNAKCCHQDDGTIVGFSECYCAILFVQLFEDEEELRTVNSTSISSLPELISLKETFLFKINAVRNMKMIVRHFLS